LASSPGALRGSFGSYRAIDAAIAQNANKMRQLSLPVLTMGAEKGLGEGTDSTMRFVASTVRGVLIPGSGHWVAEEAPEQLLAAQHVDRGTMRWNSPRTIGVRGLLRRRLP
jgi:pimeloyl-ACP methyl ester carboxylesterase